MGGAHGAPPPKNGPIVLKAYTNLEPLVDAFGVIFVAAGEDSERLSRLKLAHANDAGALAALFDLSGEPVRGQLVDLRPRQSARFGLAQPLGQVQQRLVVLRLNRISRRRAHQIRSVVQRRIRQHRPGSIQSFNHSISVHFLPIWAGPSFSHSVNNYRKERRKPG